MADRIAVESRRCLVRVGADGFDETIGLGAEERLIQLFLNEQHTIVSQGAFAEVGVRLGSDIEGVMPGDVEREGRGVGPVMELLGIRAPMTVLKSLVGRPCCRENREINSETGK